MCEEDKKKKKKKEQVSRRTAKCLHDTTAERPTRKRGRERASERAKWILGRRVRSRHRHRLRGRTQVETERKTQKNLI